MNAATNNDQKMTPVPKTSLRSSRSVRAKCAILLLSLACSVVAQLGDGFSPEELAVTAPAVAAGGGSSPAYDTAAFVPFADTDSAAPVITFTNAVSTGKMLVVGIFSNNEQGGISSVVDTAGNTYSAVTSVLTSGTRKVWIYSSIISTALTTSDTLTITWVSPAFSHQAACGLILSGVTAADVSGSGNDDNAATVTATATTTVADTVAAGFVLSADSSYASSSFDALHSAATGGGTLYATKKVFTTTGSKDIGGTCNIFQGWSAVWTAFKP